MRTTIIAIIVLTALAFTAAPVFACLNDREVEHAEKEFKSRYEAPAEGAATPQLDAEQASPTPQPAPRDDRAPMSDMLLIGVVGSLLLVTSFGATYFVHRRQKAAKI